MCSLKINLARVSGVVVTFNPDADLFKKVVCEISGQVDELIVIDNSSENKKIVGEICSDYSNVTFLFNDINVGLASAQNEGIKYALGKEDITHVILFDQDSVICAGFIQVLLDNEKSLLLQGHHVAAIGPSFYDSESNQVYPVTRYCGPFISRVDINNQTKPIEATFIIASGCMIRREVLESVGIMKDELFIDYIDVEWSLRAKSRGYKVFVVPNTSMAHQIGDKRLSIFGRKISVHSAIRRYYLFRNSFYMLRLGYIPLGFKIRELVFNVLRFLVSVTTSDNKVSYIKYGFWGLKDGLLGRFGPLDK